MTPEELELRIGQDFDGECHLTEAEARALLDRIDSLEAALAPFAEWAACIPDNVSNVDTFWAATLAPWADRAIATAGDFRRAAALSSSKQKDGGE